MFTKGIFKNTSFAFQFFSLFVTIFAGSFLVYFLMLIDQTIAVLVSGASLEAVAEILKEGALEDGNTIRSIQLFQLLAMFLLPSIFLAKLYSEDEKEYLKLETRIPFSVFVLTLASMIVAIPFLNLTVYFNEQMSLPEFLNPVETMMRSMEDQAREVTGNMLLSDNLWVILINFLIVAVLAGISEEFLFRGVMQNVFKKLFRNHHVVIWIVAVIFSAFHFQFYGFIPRMLLGAYFGYLLYYTQSIWIPVFAHFVNNAISLLEYYNSDKISELDGLSTFMRGDSWLYAVISFSVWLVFFRLIIRRCKSYHFSS